MTLFETPRRDPPQHWEWCDGGDAEFVSGARSRWWWRCPSCRWVGWCTRKKTDRPTIQRHNRPKQKEV